MAIRRMELTFAPQIFIGYPWVNFTIEIYILFQLNLHIILRSLLPHFTYQLTEALPVHTIFLVNGRISFKTPVQLLEGQKSRRAWKSFRQR